MTFRLITLDDEQIDDRYYDELTEELLYDMILPGRIPTDLSISTMTRVQNVVSLLTRIHDSIPKNSTEFSPYEGLASLLNWSDTDMNAENSTEIYAFNYMGEYSIIMKSGKDILREYSIGQVMNSLRRTVPTFVYTYGYVKDIILYHPRNERGGYCMQRSPGQHCLMLEYLHNSVPLTHLEPGGTSANVMKNSTVSVVYQDSDFIRFVLFQLLCALSYAHYSVGFVHGNLNLSNISMVRFPNIMAVPIMIPILYGKMITFKLRWILTDVMIVIGDYSAATVRHEGSNTLSSDIVQLINILREPSKNYIVDNAEILSLEADFLRILSGIQSSDYAAIVQFCNKYSDLFTSSNTSVYTNVLTTQNDRQSIDSIVIDTAQKYYWYDRYYDMLGYLPINEESIESNTWYRDKMIDPLLSTAVYDNHNLTNDLVFEAVDYENGVNVMINTALILYRYIEYFSDFKLNILPFKYTDPEDILRDAGEYISGGVSYDYDSAKTVGVIYKIIDKDHE